MESRKLYKSSKNRTICGVCGGISEFVNLDVTVVRLLFALFGCFGAGILVYIVAAVVMPEEPYEHNNTNNQYK